MISQRLFRGSIFAFAVAGSLLAPRAARADTACTQDSDCSKGFTCQMTGVEGCGVAVGPCSADSGCAPPTSTVTCQPQAVMTCEPGPCTTDDDCGDGMVCYADTYEECPSPPACPAGEKCATTDITCTQTTMSSCVFKYQLPCQTDSDCGDDFTCVPDTESECSGSGSASGGGATSGGTRVPVDAGVSGSVAPSSGSAVSEGGNAASSSAASEGDDPPPPAEDAGGVDVSPAVDAGALKSPVDGGSSYSCTTVTLPTSSCAVKSIACSDDGDCPSGWTCEGQNYACAASASSDGGTSSVCNAPSTVVMQCIPPYYSTPGNTLSSGASYSADVDAGASAPTIAAGGSSQGNNETGGSTGTAGGTGTSTGGGNTAQGSGAAPGGSAGSSAQSASFDSPTGSSGGCQMGTGPATPVGSSILAWLGLGAFAATRRRRSAANH